MTLLVYSIIIIIMDVINKAHLVCMIKRTSFHLNSDINSHSVVQSAEVTRHPPFVADAHVVQDGAVAVLWSSRPPTEASELVPLFK